LFCHPTDARLMLDRFGERIAVLIEIVIGAKEVIDLRDTRAMIIARSKPGWDTRTSSARSVTPNWHLMGSGTSGGSKHYETNFFSDPSTNWFGRQPLQIRSKRNASAAATTRPVSGATGERRRRRLGRGQQESAPRRPAQREKRCVRTAGIKRLARRPLVVAVAQQDVKRRKEKME
jgi:hypothetical protein